MSGNNKNNNYVPAADESQLILRWLKRARESQFTHYRMGVIFDRLHLCFGVPVIITTTIVSGSIFAAIQREAAGDIKYWVMGVSLIAVVLSSLQTFLKFSERAEKHRVAAAEYGSIRRRLEIAHVTSPVDKSVLEKLGDEISALAVRAPAISDSTFDRIKKKLNS